jgi:hypothetical protein
MICYHQAATPASWLAVRVSRLRRGPATGMLGRLTGQPASTIAAPARYVEQAARGGGELMRATARLAPSDRHASARCGPPDGPGKRPAQRRHQEPRTAAPAGDGAAGRCPGPQNRLQGRGTAGGRPAQRCRTEQEAALLTDHKDNRPAGKHAGWGGRSVRDPGPLSRRLRASVVQVR